jgi:hypothetical protein
MKIVDTIVVHTGHGNETRQEIVDYCEEMFGERGATWATESDYTGKHSDDGTFNVVFTIAKDAHFFMIKWGGMVVNVTYKQEQGLEIDGEAFANLFEEVE